MYMYMYTYIPGPQVISGPTLFLGPTLFPGPTGPNHVPGLSRSKSQYGSRNHRINTDINDNK